MEGKWLQSSVARRGFLARLGVEPALPAQRVSWAPRSRVRPGCDGADALWRPARHAQDDWYDKIPGVHRFLFDTSSPDAMGWAMQFATNYFTMQTSKHTASRTTTWPW